MPVIHLPPSQAAEATAVLCDAFRDYPVMRHVIGERPDYAARLETLIGFFVAARVHRQDLILGLRDGAGLVGAALVTLPGERPVGEALARHREAVWAELGAEARARYEAFGAATQQHAIAEPHHHLNMIGVRRSHAGRGLARVLLDHVHAVAEADAGSAGVTLSTETAVNVPLYRHFGYTELGHAVVGPRLETWVFYRPRAGAGGGTP